MLRASYPKVVVTTILLYVQVSLLVEGQVVWVLKVNQAAVCTVVYVILNVVYKDFEMFYLLAIRCSKTVNAVRPFSSKVNISVWTYFYIFNTVKVGGSKGFRCR